jgi:hypothetical protein
MTVADRPGAQRYELLVDGEPSGFMTYRLDGDVIAMLHTEVDPEREGRGLGSELVAHALDDARARGLRVRPVCSFVVDYIRRHPDYSDLLA